MKFNLKPNYLFKFKILFNFNQFKSDSFPLSFDQESTIIKKIMLYNPDFARNWTLIFASGTGTKKRRNFRPPKSEPRNRISNLIWEYTQLAVNLKMEPVQFFRAYRFAAENPLLPNEP